MACPPYAFARQGNNVCYEAVRAFAHVHSIKYELLIRQRSDHFTIIEDASVFAPPLRPGYAIDHLVVPNDQHYMGVNDRFGIGGFDVMIHHMGRYCRLSRETVWNPWGEPYLKCAFNESGIPIVFEDALRTRHGGGYDRQLIHCGTHTPDIPALTRSG